MAGKNVFTVEEVTKHIKGLLERDFILKTLTVKGEISNWKPSSSGHIYFTLKDQRSQIPAVMWSSNAESLKRKPKDGDKVVITGSVEVYGPHGKYQLIARTITPEGVGALYEQYEALKKKLEEEGLFDPIYKVPIPQYARRLGVVTSPTGQAIKDITRVTKRRNPYTDIILYPSLVQGEGSAENVVAGIKALSDPSLAIDVIIVGRGGGSIEELWTFNDEAVARAIFDCPVPIISAVGHQGDVLISDFVADLRAATPSEAAERAVIKYSDFESVIQDCYDSLNTAIDSKIRHCREGLDKRSDILRHLSPSNMLKDKKNRLAHCREKLYSIMDNRLWRSREGINSRREIIGRLSPVNLIRRRREQLTVYGDKLNTLEDRRLKTARHDLEVYAARLKPLSPLEKLSGGRGLIYGPGGQAVRSVKDVRVGDTVNVCIHDGDIVASVDSIREKQE